MAEMNEELMEEQEGLSHGKGESLWKVYIRRFRKHTLGKVGGIILLILYGLALFAGFFSPYTKSWLDKKKSYHPPTTIRFIYTDEKGQRSFKPFVYEERIVNTIKKEYGIVPEYSLRVVSRETQADIRELNAISAEKDSKTRKDFILTQVMNYYDLDRYSPEIKKLETLINQAEKDTARDIVLPITLGTRNRGGEEVPMNIYLIKGNKNFLKFFYQGVPYKFWGLFTTQVHFYGSPTGGFYFWGTDKLGRDFLSRLFYGSRISLSIGLMGAIITFILGLIMGGVSGYFGGVVDNLIMRFGEVMMSFPSIYLLFALRASFPSDLSSVQIYMLIVIILSLVGWASLARLIRGMVLSIKNEDFVLSAKTMGLSHWKIISRHILPNTMSVVIVQATLTIPGYILGESALSLLGLGIHEPESSWGLMLSAAKAYRVVQDFPWILIPGFAIFLAILAWNFFGDGVRDAVDPKSKH